MKLILAIDSDPRQSEQLASLVRKLKVDLVQATSAGEGLHALRDRVPDLILTSPLLSPFDDGVLDEYLRDLGAAATHVQTLRIPVLSATPKTSAAKRLFSLGRKTRTSSAAPDGCDPRMFADEIALYLTRAAEERRASSSRAAEGAQARAPEYVTELVEASEYVADPVDEYAEAVAYVEATPEGPEVEPATEYVYHPEPTYAVERSEEQPQDLFVAATEEPAAVDVAPAVEAVPAPVPAPVPAAPVAPVAVQPPASARQSSPSFEAALAAIRAAWATPAKEGAVAPAPVSTVAPQPVSLVAPQPASSVAPHPVSSVAPHPVSSVAPPPALASGGRGSKPVGAAQVEVDLTNQIDALEDVIGGAEAPSADQEPADDDPKTTPSERRKIDKSKKRPPEKPRGRKTRGQQDDWGIFDPNQCDFSALVNKLDEVTDSDELTPGMIATARIITAG